MLTGNPSTELLSILDLLEIVRFALMLLFFFFGLSLSLTTGRLGILKLRALLSRFLFF